MTTHTESFFTPQFLVNHPVYAITVIFIYLLSDKASNAEFFQIFPVWTLSHINSKVRLLSFNNFKTKPTIAYSNPTVSCLSLRCKSSGNNLGETEVLMWLDVVFPRWYCSPKPRLDRGKIAANGPIFSSSTVLKMKCNEFFSMSAELPLRENEISSRKAEQSCMARLYRPEKNDTVCLILPVHCKS